MEQPLEDTVKDDLQLIDYAVKVLDRMSDASSVMAMKRMNVVASELASRARRIAVEAQNGARAGKQPSPSASQVSYTLASEATGSAQSSSDALQWKWSSAGVEAWPRMDVFLVRLGPYRPPTGSWQRSAAGC